MTIDTHSRAQQLENSQAKESGERTPSGRTAQAILHYAHDVCHCDDPDLIALFGQIDAELDHTGGRPSRQLAQLFRDLNRHLTAVHD